LELPFIRVQFLTNIPEKVLLESLHLFILRNYELLGFCFAKICQCSFVVVVFFFFFSFLPDWNLVFSYLNISTIILPLSIRTHSTPFEAIATANCTAVLAFGRGISNFCRLRSMQRNPGR